jgi:precorrin-2 dehydrogenase/sirohydrochlorin ferrochelatase
MQHYYPLLVDLTDKLCVVIGAGDIAARRVRSLVKFDTAVRVVAPDAVDSIRELAQLKAITWLESDYAPPHLDGAFLAIAATNRRDVNVAVTRDAKARGILVSCADLPAEGSFITPAVVSRGDLSIAASTAGSSPTLAAVVRDDLDTQFGPEWDAITQLFGRIRNAVKTSAPTETGRKAVVRAILDDAAVRDAVVRGDLTEAEALARRCLS